jgi:hypothetical protein
LFINKKAQAFRAEAILVFSNNWAHERQFIAPAVAFPGLRAAGKSRPTPGAAFGFGLAR